MTIAVRYFTRSGNTKRLAEGVAEALGVAAESVEAGLSEKTEAVFLCNSVYAAGVDDAVKSFIAANKDKIGTLYNLSTAALLTSSYKMVRKLAEENGVTLSEKEFHCRGQFGPLHANRPTAADIRNAADFAKGVLA